ncbi:MAG: DUF4760 domain-containing protein [Acidobacteriaceae bacterium]
MKDAENSIRQAELILKLYDLRRESMMRLARGYVGGPFLPHSADEFVSLITAGTKEGGYILQVYGYWDMLAGFVVHGALDETLVYDTCQEMYFQYAKIQPYLAEIRLKIHLPEYFRGIEAVVEGSDQGRARLQDMKNSLAAIAAARTPSP